jgi:hypothetical protein
MISLEKKRRQMWGISKNRIFVRVPSLIAILVFETPCQQQGKSMLNKVSSNYTKKIGASVCNILMTSMASMQLKG